MDEDLDSMSMDSDLANDNNAHNDSGDNNSVQEGGDVVDMVIIRDDPDLSEFRLVTTDNEPDGTESNETVADNGDESDNGEEVPFDIQLPYQHLYLARNFQALPGHTYLEEGSVQTLPLIPANLIMGLRVLIPGQTIPLNYSNPEIVNAIRESLDENHNMFGFLQKKIMHDPKRHIIASRDLGKIIGVTLEIFEVGSDEDHQGEFCCKARVTQRFRVLDCVSSGRWFAQGRVLILPEIVLEDPLQPSCPASLERWRRGSKRAVCDLQVAQTTAWPSFVYRQYELTLVVATAKQYFLTLLTDKNACCAKVPDDPVQLSYWILINFPMSDSIRVEMLSLNNALHRLHRLIDYFKNYHQSIRCIGCFQEIGLIKDIFFMSASGPQGVYINPNGFTHETITLYKVDNIILDPVVSTQYSWFPGYAWSIASCARCHCHVGWRFKAVKRALVPKCFYGITKRAITLPGRAQGERREDETDDMADNMLPPRLLAI
ncbi:hypothetical protein M8J75_012181 [Diaphorina citri]|nr:hypothetical protein M8J75_012181 [Diaphorina citri]